MNQQTIPENNLPIYLQNYTASVQCGADNCGSVRYNTVGLIPSDVSEKRVWNFKVSGILQPVKDIIQIIFNFQNVEYDGEITFENKLSGYLTICGRVLDLSKSGFYEYNSRQKILVIGISQERWGFSIKRETNFYLNVDIDDAINSVSLVDDTYFQLCSNIEDKGVELPYAFVGLELDFTLIGAPPTGTYPTPNGTPVPSCPCTSTPCPTFSPCPTLTPCPTPIAENCLRSFTDGISFDYPEVMENTDNAFEQKYINGVGTIDTIANSCYNTVQNFPAYVGVDTNSNNIWTLKPVIVFGCSSDSSTVGQQCKDSTFKFITGPTLTLFMYSLPSTKTIVFEKINFGAYTLFEISFPVNSFSDIESLQDYNFVINCQNLNINDNPFAIMNFGYTKCDEEDANTPFPSTRCIVIKYNIIYNKNSSSASDSFYTLEPVIPVLYAVPQSDLIDTTITMLRVIYDEYYGFKLIPTSEPAPTPTPICTPIPGPSSTCTPTTSSTTTSTSINTVVAYYLDSDNDSIEIQVTYNGNTFTINENDNVVYDSSTNSQIYFKGSAGIPTPVDKIYYYPIQSVYLYFVTTQIQYGNIYVFCSSVDLYSNPSYITSLNLSAEVLSILKKSQNIQCTSACPPSLPCPSPGPAPTAFPFPPITCTTPAPSPSS